MQLSVLSALTRMDVDPWEEATRLAAMPKAIAERTLVSTLDQVLGKSCQRSETDVIAARLVQLLPQRGEGATVAQTETARVGTQQAYWFVWLGFALAISLLSPRHQVTDAGGATSKSGAIHPGLLTALMVAATPKHIAMARQMVNSENHILRPPSHDLSF
jgi:hypothetical protein